MSDPILDDSDIILDDDKHARDFGGKDDHSRVAEWREGGLWIIVLNMSGRNFCTYIGIPVDHPLAGYDYDLLPVDAHGGLTFGDYGDGEYRPEGYYWYGWDYGHYGDFTYYGDRDTSSILGNRQEPLEDEHDWTVGEVKKDAWHAIYDMKRLKKLSEQIYSKAKEK